MTELENKIVVLEHDLVSSRQGVEWELLEIRREHSIWFSRDEIRWK